MRRRSTVSGRAGRWGVAALAVVAVAAFAGRAAAENRVTVRGAYYREPSTRVAQPMVQVRTTSPEGVDVSAHYLMDAITSASVVAGVNMMDKTFTEVRNETGLTIGKRIARTRLALSYRYSHEPDYRSHTVALTLEQGVWDNTGTLLVNLARGRDVLDASLDQRLNVWFAGLAYTQALAPTWSAQFVYDLTVQRGFVGNPYFVQPNYGHENPPAGRARHAAAVRIATYLPSLGLGLQLHGRVYLDHELLGSSGPDPWQKAAGTGEVRIYKMLGSELELRLSYRATREGSANFFCVTPPGAFADCYSLGRYERFRGRYSADEKFGSLTSHFPEAKLTWELRELDVLPRFLARGAVDVSYGYFFQVTHYRNAHLLQTGYSLPF